MTEYDGGAWNGVSFKSRVQNMVVYGNPDPPIGAAPVVPSLTTTNVTVTPKLDASGVPNRVTVQVDGFKIPDGEKGLFAGFTLNAKPKCSFEYNGRYTVP